MELDRLLVLCGATPDNEVIASWSSVCERCLVLDGPRALRHYRHVCELADALRGCGIGDSSLVVAHHDRIEVRYEDGVDLCELARLPWRTSVDYREPGEGYRRRAC